MIKKILNKKYFLIIFIMIIYLIPLLLSNHYYMDDNVRVVTGKPDWGWQGRPLADWLYYALSLSTYHIKDLFPYSLLTGIVILSLYYVKIENFSFNQKKYNLISIIPFLFILINPFFIQNISYRYDSLPMILGLITSISSYLIVKSNIKFRYIYSILLLIASLSLYQPCVNAYLIMMFYSMILLNFQFYKDYFKIIIKQLLIFIIAVVSYDLLIMKLLHYGTSRSTLIGFDNTGLIFEKIIFFFSGLIFQLPSLITIFIIILILVAFYLVVNTAKNKILSIMSFFGMFLSLWGGLLLIKENVDLPREFPVFGLYLCLLSSFILIFPKYRKLFTLLFSIMLILNIIYFYQYMFLYVNQKDYESKIEDNIVMTVKNDEVLKHKIIYINGKPPYKKEITKIIDDNVFLKRMINTSDEWVTRYALYRKGLTHVKLNFKAENLKVKKYICINHKIPYYSNEFYDIYLISNHIELFLKRSNNICSFKSNF